MHLMSTQPHRIPGPGRCGAAGVLAARGASARAHSEGAEGEGAEDGAEGQGQGPRPWKRTRLGGGRDVYQV